MPVWFGSSMAGDRAGASDYLKLATELGESRLHRAGPIKFAHIVYSCIFPLLIFTLTPHAYHAEVRSPPDHSIPGHRLFTSHLPVINPGAT